MNKGVFRCLARRFNKDLYSEWLVKCWNSWVSAKVLLNNGNFKWRKSRVNKCDDYLIIISALGCRLNND